MSTDLFDMFSKVFADYGYDIKRFKAPFIKRRLDRRMRIIDVHDYTQYAAILKEERQEFEELFASLSINVTNFFRDFMVYDRFKSSILPRIISSSHQHDKIRVWSAGCASGEEAYSLAIMFTHAIGKLNNLSMEIIASDINKKTIEYAKNGIYSAKSVEQLPLPIVAQNFQKLTNANNIVEYEIISNIKNLVTFKVGDILSNDMRCFDVIFCRNVLIYYEREAQELIVTKFHHCLKDSGYLVLGMDETLLGRKCEKLFYPLMARERIYQKVL